MTVNTYHIRFVNGTTLIGSKPLLPQNTKHHLVLFICLHLHVNGKIPQPDIDFVEITYNVRGEVL